MLKVRTGPESPEDNLRELREIATQTGIARERDKRKNRENFPMKGSNLMHELARSQNKGLNKYQRRASQLHTGPSPAARGNGRHATATGGRQGAISAPETGILHQTVNRLLAPVANQVFLGS